MGLMVPMGLGIGRVGLVDRRAVGRAVGWMYGVVERADVWAVGQASKQAGRQAGRQFFEWFHFCPHIHEFGASNFKPVSKTIKSQKKWSQGPPNTSK